MTADMETIREALTDWVPEGEGYVMDGRFRPHLVEALAALGRVEERERAAWHLADRACLFDGPELRRWIGSNQVEPVLKQVAQAVALVAGALDLAAALAGSVAAGRGEE